MVRKRRKSEQAIIADELRPLVRPLSELALDPANARTHDEANLAAIRGSLRTYGQRKPIVVNRRTGTIEAGNGTYQAALALGWTEIAAIFVDDDPSTAAGYAIADNRAGELAGWDTQALDALLRTVQVGDDELQQMLSQLAQDAGIVPAEEKSSGDQPATPQLDEELQHKVLLSCRDEAHQAELLERFQAEGLECKALIV